MSNPVLTARLLGQWENQLQKLSDVAEEAGQLDRDESCWAIGTALLLLDELRATREANAHLLAEVHETRDKLASLRGSGVNACPLCGKPDDLCVGCECYFSG